MPSLNPLFVFIMDCMICPNILIVMISYYERHLYTVVIFYRLKSAELM